MLEDMSVPGSYRSKEEQEQKVEGHEGMREM
jgi:hypothetical protein